MELLKPNTSLKSANKAKEQIVKVFGQKEWYVDTEVKHNPEFGYFLNVQSKTPSFDSAKEELPLIVSDTFVFVEAIS